MGEILLNHVSLKTYLSIMATHFVCCTSIAAISVVNSLIMPQFRKFSIISGISSVGDILSDIKERWAMQRPVSIVLKNTHGAVGLCHTCKFITPNLLK